MNIIRGINTVQGPKLFRIFQNGSTAGRNYEPSLVESGADKVIGTIRFCWSLSYWTSPLLLGILYRRGHFTAEGIVNLGKFVMYVGTLYYTAVLVRGFGRFMNPDYMTFITVLTDAQKVFNEQNRRLLSGFDYQYWASPVAWRWTNVNIGEVKKMKIQAKSNRDPPRSLLSIPSDILSYICANTFGRRMVYPGATALINTLVEGPLCQGRAKLIEEKHGIRAKLLTEDNNEIDTMFVDRRADKTRHGNTLVVTCEGNAGFYEIGAMATPLDLEYSVIGWNHPGFAGSSGVPFPDQEQSAIDAVMQYSIHELGFTPDNIILYAWSIGGYTATWAAMNYPDVKFTILDATFDDIMPLAYAKMPEFARGLVEKTVNRYLNLNIADQLLEYPGPVLLIRRSRDEMLTTLDPTAIHTNRGNFLLLKLLSHRYPKIVDNTTIPILEDYLSKEKAGQEVLMAAMEVDREWCTVAMRSYMEEAENTKFPLDIGTDYTEQQKTHMTLFLASKHMEDFNSTHCTPLPTQFFKQPWTP
ncbi:phosphatidylserine lipase ABHD16A-like [Ruditapes philippinarum]|uniref:phosphatidylserine lipase ABHD16A-like n=1 Tax=Ruditapes philippinarum TaxID=129788 RepID=UPI00295C02B8|nr:phosphatidylserine lipase ABHD16A-like [Ruditapes philippinarum]